MRIFKVDKIGIATVLAVVLLFGVVLATAIKGRPEGADFGALYTGALMVRQGKAARLYDLSAQTRIQEALFKRKGLLLYAYPPLVAALFAPVTLFSYRVAYVVWGGINVVLWALFVSLRRKIGMKPGMSGDLFILSFLFCPFWVALIEGQVSIFMLMVFALTFVRLRRSADYSSGLILGLGLLKFQDVLPLAVIFLLRRKWKFMAGLLTTGTILGFVSVAIVGAGGARSYVALLTDIVTHPNRALYATVRSSNMPTIGALVTALLPRTPGGSWIPVATTLALSGALIFFLARSWNKVDGQGGQTSLKLMFGAALSASLLISPHVNIHDLTAMLLAVALAISAPQWQGRSRCRTVLTVAATVLYAFPIYFLLAGRGESYLLAPVLAVFSLASICLARKVPIQLAGTPTVAATQISSLVGH